MQPLITSVRAIGTEFVRRTTRPLIIIGLILAIALLAGGGWLAAHNAWWWILEAVFILYALFFAAAVIALRMILKLAEPPMSTSQRKKVAEFVDKLERTSENLQTPQPVIIFRIIRDIVRRNGQDSFVAKVSRDTRSLAPDFAELQKSFDER